MNLYFELPLDLTGEPVNLVRHNVGDFQPFSYPTRQIFNRANRVWQENDQGISFIKNRYVDPNTPVDMEEFMWIKLNSATS